MSGVWVVYLMDPCDPEQDEYIFTAGSYDDACEGVDDHADYFGNDPLDYSIEWEDEYSLMMEVG